MSNQVVQNNSIYVVTQPLDGGLFHWSILLVDANGRASLHQRCHHTNKSSSRDQPPYRAQIVAKPSLADSGNILAYFWIPVVAPPSEAMLAQACQSTAGNPQQVTRTNTICQLWVANVLRGLRSAGVVQPSLEIGQLENFIRRKSLELESIYIASQVQRSSYVSRVVYP
jgi:hypothetical protein